MSSLAKQYYKNAETPKKKKALPASMQTSKTKLEESSKKLEAELKSLRILLKGGLDKLTVSMLKEVEAIKKPQRYQFFIGKLFYVFTDLVIQAEGYTSALHSKKGLSKLTALDKEFNRDI